jgi:hypothetical protein
MKPLRAGLLAIWEFVVGDDWRTAVGASVGLALTAAIAASGVPAWWVMPLIIVVLLVLSIRRALRLR